MRKNTAYIIGLSCLFINNSAFAVDNTGTMNITSNYISNAGITNEVSGTINNNSNFNSLAEINNYGIINNYSAGNILNYSLLINNDVGNINNSGYLLNIYKTASIVNSGRITNSIGAQINMVSGGSPSAGTLTNNSSGSIDNYGTILIDQGGKLDNLGALMNNAGSSLDNFGTLTNDNSISNAGTLTNEASSHLNNAGTLTNNSSGSITNAGTLTNNAGGSLDNLGTITNNNSISNAGTLTNEASSNLNNLGTLANNNIFSNDGAITNNSSGSITNAGEITNNAGGSLDNFGTITNNNNISNAGTLTNEVSSHLNNLGTIINNSGASLDNFGTITNSNNISNAGTLTNEDNSNLNNAGTITNSVSGSITNAGTLTNNAGGRLDNFGVLTNSNSISNNGTLTNEASSNLNNAGTITNNSSGSIINAGEITNNAGGSLDNFGVLTNDNSISNNGTLTNKVSSNLNNSGTLVNNNIFSNAGTITNDNSIGNAGTLTNEVNSHLNNAGTITNYFSGSITNLGTMTNDGVIRNYGTISIIGGNVLGTGNLAVESGGRLTIHDGLVSARTSILTGGAETITGGAVSNIKIDGGELNISGGSVSNITENAGDLYVSGGLLNLFNGTSVGNHLTIANLSGNAAFVINTDVANNLSDTITINDSSSYGSNMLKVNYDPSFSTWTRVSGTAIFATTASSNVTFTAASTEYGAHSYLPTISSAGGIWTVNGFTSNFVNGSDASETVYSGLDNIKGTLAFWRASNNNLIRRMGDLRNSDGTTGEWTRIYSGKQILNGLNNRQTTAKYTAIQGGYDTKHSQAAGTWITGYAMGYLKGNMDLDRGSGKSDTATAGLYASWIGNKGHYIDLITKVGKVRTSYDSYLNNASATKVTGNYSSWESSLSAEYGYRQKLQKSWYLEPQAEINLAHVGSADYTISDSTVVHNDSAMSLIGRVGLAIGREVNKNNMYLKTSIVREFQGDSRVRMASGGSIPVVLTDSLKDTWLEFDFGWTKKYAVNCNSYVEFTRMTGSKSRTPWQLNIGVRKAF